MRVCPSPTLVTLLVCPLALIACAEPPPPPDPPPVVVETYAAAADPQASCLDTLPDDRACIELERRIIDGAEACACTVAQVHRIDVRAEPEAILPGEVAKLDAQPYDADGRPLIARISFPTIDPGLPIADGKATGVTIGDHFIVARAGGVLSLPSYVLVDDPRDREMRALEGRVIFPAGLAPKEALIKGPDGRSRRLADSGRFRLEGKAWRNQRITVLDGDGQTELLSAIARGFVEGQPAEPLTVNLRSTAEALVFMQPGIVDPDPQALIGFQAVAGDMPAIAELEHRLLANWQTAGAPQADRAAVDAAVRSAAADTHQTARDLLAEAAAKGLPLGQGCGVQPGDVRDGELLIPSDAPADYDRTLPFAPRVDPTFASGLVAQIVYRNARQIAVCIENRHVRRVDLYVEEVPTHGGRGRLRKVRFLGAHTNLPTTGRIIAGGLLEGDPLAQLNSPGSALIDLLLPPQTSWRIFAYGPGALGDNVPDHIDDSPEQRARRLIFPTVRTLLLDVAANALSVGTSLDNSTVKSRLARLTESVAHALTAGNIEDALARLLQGDAAGELLGLGFDVAISAASESLQTGFARFLDIYDAGVAGLDLFRVIYDYNRSHSVEVFTVTDGAVYITPPTLEDAVAGCPYQQDIRVEGGSAPFRWEFEPYHPAGLQVRGLDVPGDGRAQRVELRNYGAGLIAFEARVYRADLADGSAPVLARHFFELTARPPAPQITAVRFPRHAAGAAPGEPAGVPVEVDVTDCRGFGELLSGQITGHPVLGAAPLAATVIDGTAARLTGVLPMASPLQDDPLDRVGGRLRVRVTNDGRATTRDRRLPIRNVAPSDIDGDAQTLDPGARLDLNLDGFDLNWDTDSRIEVKAADVRVSGHDAALATTADLLTAPWALVAHQPATGGFLFRLDRPTALAAAHRDTDGTTASADDDAPISIRISVTDDQGATGTGTARVVVRNKAPEIGGVRFEPAVLPPHGAGPRPVTIFAEVTDANTAADIGPVAVDLASLGLGDALAPMQPTGDGRTWRLALPDVPADCRDICAVRIIALDADDEPANGGRTERIAGLRELNLPPVADTVGLTFAEQPDPNRFGPRICTGQTVRFAVAAADPNGTPVTADLLFENQRSPMVRQPGGAFVTDKVMPARAGFYGYLFEIREAGGPLSTRTAERFIDVSDCDQPRLDRGPCWPSPGEAETCDGLDDDCDGAIDEGACGEPEPACPAAIALGDGARVTAGSDGRLLIADGEALSLLDPATCESARWPLDRPVDGLALDGESLATVSRGVVSTGPLGGEPRIIAEGADASAGFGLAAGRLLMVLPSRRGPIARVVDARSGARILDAWIGPDGRAALSDSALIISTGRAVELLPLPGAEPIELTPAAITPDMGWIERLRASGARVQWVGEGAEGPTLGLLGAGDAAGISLSPRTVDAVADGRSVAVVEAGEDGQRLVLLDRERGEEIELAASGGPIEQPLLLDGYVVWRADGALRFAAR